MLPEKQRRTALKKNIEYARAMARRLRAEGMEGITLTHFADEKSFHAMRLPEEDYDCTRAPAGGSSVGCKRVFRVAWGTPEHIPSSTGLSWWPTRDWGRGQGTAWDQVVVPVTCLGPVRAARLRQSWLEPALWLMLTRPGPHV